MSEAGGSVGRTLAHYQITAAIGAGGMGEVYRATDTRLGREVAIKVLPPAFAADHDRLARFDREARAVAALSHPNILALFDVGTHEGTAYVVTELLEGETLHARLAAGPVPVRKATDYAAQVARGLAAAHDKGIVHRDVKPENLFVTAEGRVKILDFGLARRDEPDRDPGDTRSPTLARPTDAGAVMGTVGYMSPEQVRGQVVDARSDIFSLGCVVHEMISGRRAFLRETAAETMTAILREDPPALADGCPAVLARVVERCLEKTPGERFQSARDLAFALESSTSASGRQAATAVDPPAALARRRSRVLLALGALAALALSAAAGALLTRGTRKEPPTFRQLTDRRGMIHSARFAPDQQGIVYGGAFEGAPVALFSTRADAIDSRSLALPSADVAGISRGGDMAVLLGRRNTGSWLRVGTLARVSMDGGSPQPLLENVFDADISADGSTFAVVRQTGSSQQLEHPIGTVLFRNEGWIGLPRLARDGRRVAFVDHPFYGDDRGFVTVVGPDGKAERISTDLNGLQGLAWSPSGNAVWASANDRSVGSAVWECAPGRAARRLISIPGSARLHDVSTDGRLLMTADETRAEIEGLLAGSDKPRPYSWWSDDVVGAVAADGSFFAGVFTASGSGGEYTSYLRKSDGSAPSRIGPGVAGGITPDGKWVITALLVSDRQQFTLYPTGPGQPRRVSLGSVVPEVGGPNDVSSSADGRRLAFLGNAPGEGVRGYVVDIETAGAPKAVTPEGMTGSIALSPDGQQLAVVDGGGVLRVHPVAGGPSAPVAGARPGEIPIAWDSSGRALFVWDQSFPGDLARVDLATGQRETRLHIAPLDPAGVIYGQLGATADARYYMIRFRRKLSALTLVEGLQ